MFDTQEPSDLDAVGWKRTLDIGHWTLDILQPLNIER